jgi:hypothetical protein
MRATFCVVLGLLACNDKSDDSSDGGGEGGDHGTGTTDDLDADRYVTPDDCDDANADVHPGASEV